MFGRKLSISKNINRKNQKEFDFFKKQIKQLKNIKISATINAFLIIFN